MVLKSMPWNTAVHEAQERDGRQGPDQRAQGIKQPDDDGQSEVRAKQRHGMGFFI